MTRKTLFMVCAAAWLSVGVVLAQKAPAAAGTLTPQDRAEIQDLVARYASALSGCRSQEYAELFVPDGTFTSDDFRGPRHRAMYGPNGGTLVGREKLAELVETEEFCLEPSSNRRSRTAAPPPEVVIVPTAEGATGRIDLPSKARYEDVYVKTAEGWRFKSRKVVMPPRPSSPSSR